MVEGAGCPYAWSGRSRPQVVSNSFASAYLRPSIASGKSPRAGAEYRRLSAVANGARFPVDTTPRTGRLIRPLPAPAARPGARCSACSGEAGERHHVSRVEDLGPGDVIASAIVDDASD